VTAIHHLRYRSLREQPRRAVPPADPGPRARHAWLLIARASATILGCPCSRLQSFQSTTPSGVGGVLPAPPGSCVWMLERNRCGARMAKDFCLADAV